MFVNIACSDKRIKKLSWISRKSSGYIKLKRFLLHSADITPLSLYLITSYFKRKADFCADFWGDIDLCKGAVKSYLDVQTVKSKL